MENRDALSQELERLVLKKGLAPGDRLPAERQLSEDLHISRNTLRGLLRTLEARGLVSIKRGSGTYLRTRLVGNMDCAEHGRTALRNPTAEQIETAFLFLPIIVKKACTNISDHQIKELQICNITLSQGMYARNTERVWAEISRFFRIIAQGTDNTFLVKMVEQIFCIDNTLLDHFFYIDRGFREDLFAGHVNILQALREDNSRDIAGITREYILNLCRAMECREKFSLWHHMAETLKDQKMP